MRRTVPGTCGCSPAFVYPYDVVTVERPVGSVTFESRDVPRDCRVF